MLPDIYSLTEYKYAATIPTVQFVIGIAGEVFEWIFENRTGNRAVDVGDKPGVVRCCCYPAAAAVLLFNHEGPAVRSGSGFEDRVAFGVLT